MNEFSLLAWLLKKKVVFFFPLKKVLADYLSFTKCWFFFLGKGKDTKNLQLSSHIFTPSKVKIRKIINIWILITPPEILLLNSLNLHLCSSSTWICTVKCLYTDSSICELSCHVHLKVWNKSAVDTSEAMPRDLIFLEVAKFSMICTKYCLVIQYSLWLFGFFI